MRRPDGSIYYNCNICRDSGFVHPLKDNGEPDYKNAVPCQCRVKGEQGQLKEEAKK